jgi:hypothetical protein
VSTVTFRDETPTGREIARFSLPDLPTTATARELIRWRVREEVAKHNLKPGQPYGGLVQPPRTEVELKRRLLDWERQAAIAERAFTRNGFFLMVGDRQIEELDELVDLTGDPEISFVRLVALVGG